MAKNYYITLEVHDEGEWPRIAPEDLMQHVDVRLPSGLTLAHAAVSEQDPFLINRAYACQECGQMLATDESDTCASCIGKAASAYDPDHLNPAKGGNQAGDDYW